MNTILTARKLLFICHVSLLASLTACGNGTQKIPDPASANLITGSEESGSGTDVSMAISQLTQGGENPGPSTPDEPATNGSFVISESVQPIDPGAVETISIPESPTLAAAITGPEVSIEIDQIDPPSSVLIPSPVPATSEPEVSTPETTQIQVPEPEATAPQETISALEPSQPANSSFPEKFNTIGQAPGDVTRILSNLQVSTSQTNIQQSPIDVEHGYVYTANIEHGPDGDANGVNLLTVVRQGIQDDQGNWQWSKATVEDRTIHDEWHTAPSVAVDKDGYVHVVYNMHNFPWQYKTSTTPHDIGNLVFQGQAVTQAEINRSKFENKTSFPTLGTAKIPGNQITYPAFFKDHNRDLYLSYRFAAKPARSFESRTMSSGISKFDASAGLWYSIGGTVSTTSGDYQLDANAPATPTALAAKEGWTSYHPRLMFGPNNELYTNWFWREGIAGAELTRPCLLKSNDQQAFYDATGNYTAVPATPENCGNLGYPDHQEFYSIGNSTMDSTGKPYVLLSPIGDSRQIVSFNAGSQSWTREPSPNNATELFFDSENTLWAVGSGIVIMKRVQGSTTWETVYQDNSGGNCYPKAKLNSNKSIAYIHTHGCDSKSVSIYALRLK